MGGEGHSPEGRAQDRVAGREPGVHGAAPAVRAGAAGCRRGHPALPSLQDALTAALHRRVAQRAARDYGAHPPLVGYICERCLDTPGDRLRRLQAQRGPGAWDVSHRVRLSRRPMSDHGVLLFNNWECLRCG
jgi:hypothetical protein